MRKLSFIALLLVALPVLATWAEDYSGAEDQVRVILTNDDDGAGKCTLRARCCHEPTAAAAAEGAVAKCWWEVLRVPCGNIAGAFTGAELVDDAGRPAAWPNPVTTAYTPP